MNETAISSGDTAWLLVSTALVFLMTPGLAFFYGGLVSRRHVLNTLMMTVGALCVAAIIWVLVGYSLAFVPGGALVGGLAWVGFQGVGDAPQSDYAATVPHLAFAAFQGMFAVITPALIAGAVVGRMDFRAFLLFVALWCLAVYAPVAHWVWGIGGGFALRGRWILPVAPWFTSPPAVRRWWPRRSSARVRMSSVRLCVRTMCPSFCWGRGCCGSGGLVSTPVRRSRRAVLPVSRS